MKFEVTITDEARILIQKQKLKCKTHELTNEELKNSLEHILADKQIYRAVEKLVAE